MRPEYHNVCYNGEVPTNTRGLRMFLGKELNNVFYKEAQHYFVCNLLEVNSFEAISDGLENNHTTHTQFSTNTYVPHH